MIPQTKHDEAITSGNMQSATASIAMTAEMFELLSAGIYEDRPLAIIRELLCNARDAHKSVDSDKSIDLHLPNAFEPFLEIRDYGTGLNKDQMFEMYLSYGTSTKRDSNDQIGMFGIGSKSPLAYTDSFVVTSYQNGVECQYSVYKDKGIPKIDAMYTTSTEQADGLKIAIAVKSQDYYTFGDRAETFAKLFDYPLHVTGATIDSDLEYSIQEDLYSVVEGYSQGAYALMGGVPYRLSSSLAEDLRRMFKVNTMILNFEIGELNMASSRESLSFVDGDETDLAIKTRIDDVKKVFIKDMEKEVQSKETIYEVAKVLCQVYGMEKVGWNTTSKYTYGDLEWQGRTINEWHELVNTSQKVRQFTRFSDSMSTCGARFFDGHRVETLVVFHADMKTNNIKAARAYAKESRARKVFFIDADNKDYVKFLKEVFGDKVIEVKASDEFIRMFPKGAATIATYTKVSGVFKVDPITGRPVEVTQVNGTEKGFFLEMVRDNVEFNGNTYHSNDFRSIVRDGVIKDLYLIRKTSAKKNRPKGLVPLEQEIDRLVKKCTTSNVLNRAVLRHSFYQVSNVDMTVFPRVFEKVIDNYQVVRYVQGYREMGKVKGYDMYQQLRGLCWMERKFMVFEGKRLVLSDKLNSRYNNEYEKLFNDHPLLGIKSYSMTPEQKEHLDELLFNSLK